MYRGVKVKPNYPFFLANKPVESKSTIAVINKYDKKVFTNVSAASNEVVVEAFNKAAQTETAMANLPSFQRKDILLSVSQQLREREEEIATIISLETGKPIKDAKVEVGRAIDTFSLSAEEATRRHGDFMELDTTARNKGFTGITQRFPIGVISMITPFNFPLNLAAHKIGPAIASGCPFVLKPADRTPVSSSILGEILSKTSLPEGSFSILPCDLTVARNFSENPHIRMLSFTGSAEVGWKLKAAAGKKRVALELGGNAACIVDKDAKDLNVVADRIVFGAFYQGGQSCISVQRVYVHDEVYEALKVKLIERTKKLTMGDPLDVNTFVGPLISEGDVKRVESWVKEAVDTGANVLIGGKTHGTIFEPTILENVKKTCKIHCQEVFGPVCFLEKFSDFKEVCDRVNDSAYGLQAGIFTQNIHKAFYAFQNIHAGGILINEIPSARVDSQPYGGMKDSGVGREGVRYAMEEFSDVKILLMKEMGKLD